MLSKVITIAQQKGGTGKTTLAVHLAMAFIKYHNLKVAIIDTDPQGSLGKWFMIRSEKKVSNENLTFKTASLWGAQYESKTLKNDHDIVIIDTNTPTLVTKDSLLYKCGWSPFEGVKFNNSINKTIINGRIAYADSKVNSVPWGKKLTFKR